MIIIKIKILFKIYEIKSLSWKLIVYLQKVVVKLTFRSSVGSGFSCDSNCKHLSSSDDDEPIDVFGCVNVINAISNIFM